MKARFSSFALQKEAPPLDPSQDAGPVQRKGPFGQDAPQIPTFGLDGRPPPAQPGRGRQDRKRHNVHPEAAAHQSHQQQDQRAQL